MRRVFKTLGVGVIDVLLINYSYILAFLLKYDGNVRHIASLYAKDMLYISILIQH